MSEDIVCTKCGIPKTETEFYKDRRVKSGRRTECKSCFGSRRQTPSGKRYLREYTARPKTKEQRFFYKLKLYYGITKERYEELLAQQQGNCAVCGLPFDDESPVVDHDHSCCKGRGGTAKTCGKCVRGLVHARCNSMIGFGNDNPEILMRAAEYLMKFKKIEG